MRRTAVCGMAAVVVALGITGLTAPPVAAQDATHGVGVVISTFVDRTRPTDANGDCKKIPSRTLRTTIYYPSTSTPGASAQPDAAPAVDDGPFPLLVFAHGYGATADDYGALLQHWAAADFVVAAPTFPLSSRTSPCGADAGDVVNQPQDLSFVIDSVLKASRTKTAPLAGLVDRTKIGAAGHSNGGITMYGLVANTKRRDPRVKAVAILAGTPERFPGGRYDFSKVPPVLFVHGTDDDLVPYESAVETFNRVPSPKALLTFNGGDHGSPVGSDAYGATTDWFDAYLRDDSAAKQRLAGDQIPGTSVMTYAGERGSSVTLPTVPQVKLHLHATVDPHKGLVGGQDVTVTWSGYTPGKVVNILECNGGDRDLSNSAACDYTKAILLQPDPTGAGSVQFGIVEGKVGDGTCDAKHQGCFVIVNDASSVDPTHSVMVDITFKKSA